VFESCYIKANLEDFHKIDLRQKVTPPWLICLKNNVFWITIATSKVKMVFEYITVVRNDCCLTLLFDIVLCAYIPVFWKHISSLLYWFLYTCVWEYELRICIILERYFLPCSGLGVGTPTEVCRAKPWEYLISSVRERGPSSLLWSWHTCWMGKAAATTGVQACQGISIVKCLELSEQFY
jgi:hypothetical protein